MTAEPGLLYLACARNDEPLLLELEKHLQQVAGNQRFRLVHRLTSLPGDEKRSALDLLDQATCILLLISADFMVDEVAREERRLALLRKECGVPVLRVLLRAVDCSDEDLRGLPVLPRDQRAISGQPDRDLVFRQVVRELRQHLGLPEPATGLRRDYLLRVMGDASPLELVSIVARDKDQKERMQLASVYTALQTESPREGPEGRGHGPGERELVSAVAQLDRYPRLVLLGDPGSGKSTFVNFVVLCLAGEALGDPVGGIRTDLSLLTAPLPRDGTGDEERQPWRHGALVPVRVVLRDFAAAGLPAEGAQAKDLIDYIKAELSHGALDEFAPELLADLRDGRGLLMLDGLDEVPEAEQRREQLRRVVVDLLRSFPRCRVLVTARTYAYERQDFRLSGFETAMLAPLVQGQVEWFVDRFYQQAAVWHKDVESELGRAMLLKQALLSSSRLMALSETPLLLTLMTSLHAFGGGSLPEGREELYHEAVKLLLDWWEGQKVKLNKDGTVRDHQPSLSEWLRVNNRKCVRELLNQLAFEAHKGQEHAQGTADIAEGTLVMGLMNLSGEQKKQDRDVKPARLIEYLRDRAGLLLPRGVKVYSFPHRTFQEYLAACHLTDHGYPEEVAGRLKEDPERWREVALLSGAKMARGGGAAMLWPLVNELCGEELEDGCDLAGAWGAHIAGQLLVETARLDELGRQEKLSKANRRSLERVRQSLVVLLRDGLLPARERALAGEHLGRLGDPRPEITLEGMELCLVPAGPFWMGSEEGDAEEDERPIHLVNVPYDYWIGRYPVTNAQFSVFVDSGGYTDGRYWDEARQAGYWTEEGFKGYLDQNPRTKPEEYPTPYYLPGHPVVGVSWYEALAYCRWLGEGLGTRVMLPSETEWEKAARGGVRVPDGAEAMVKQRLREPVRPESTEGVRLCDNPLLRRRFPWGEKGDPERAATQETKIGTTSAVGLFPLGVGPYGCEELSGNVWEWTCSRHAGYPYEPADGRELPGGEDTRVVRGGAYCWEINNARCARRIMDRPYDWGDFRSFRLVVRPGRASLRSGSSSE